MKWRVAILVEYNLRKFRSGFLINYLRFQENLLCPFNKKETDDSIKKLKWPGIFMERTYETQLILLSIVNSMLENVVIHVCVINC